MISGADVVIADRALTRMYKEHLISPVEKGAFERLLSAAIDLNESATVGDAVADKEKGGETASGSLFPQGN